MDKPHYTLTVQEFQNMNKVLFCELIKDILKSHNEASPKKERKEDLIFIEDVYKLTGYQKATVYSKICKYEYSKHVTFHVKLFYFL